MCGRFAQFSPIEFLREDFSIKQVTCTVHPSYNITPSQKVLSVINHNGNRLGQLTWGLIPFWAKSADSFKGLINAKAETITEKPSFKYAFKKKRCLIIADGFYEWERKENTKQPYYFFRTDKKPIAFAGLWDSWKSEKGDCFDTCTIITKASAPPVNRIHNRMPVILNKEETSIWLEKESEVRELNMMVRENSTVDLTCHPVGIAVNSVKNNSPDCIIPNN